MKWLDTHGTYSTHAGLAVSSSSIEAVRKEFLSGTKAQTVIRGPKSQGRGLKQLRLTVLKGLLGTISTF
uniref:Transposase n=1 Tax=Ascaris lumbricoides TaxID=6252 RepID=A0A0M3IUG4_ASCLU